MSADAMPIEFVGYVLPVEESESRPATRGGFDTEWAARVTHAQEDAGFDSALIALGSSTPDPLMMAAHCVANSERLRFLIAHRPGFLAPTVASRMLATLDQMSGGRIAMHTISGGSDAEQRRDGDYLGKDERYARSAEYMQVLKKTWTATGPVSHDGAFYSFADYSPGIFPYQQPRIPLYFGGSSPAAYRVGAEHADVYMLFGQPLAGIAEEIETITAAAAAAGRTPPLRFSVSFRPILGATEEKAWERAHAILGRIESHLGTATGEAGFAGAKRQVDAALQGERHDRALWTAIARVAAGSSGNATALVGTPETVAAALLDYYDLGVTTILMRGFDPLEDAVQYGRELIPLVRAGVANRERRP